MRNKNIILKAEKGNAIVITDKEKYIQDVKLFILDANRFVQLNISPVKYLNYIINIEKENKPLFKNLLDFVTKLIKMNIFYLGSYANQV